VAGRCCVAVRRLAGLARVGMVWPRQLQAVQRHGWRCRSGGANGGNRCCYSAWKLLLAAAAWCRVAVATVVTIAVAEGGRMVQWCRVVMPGETR